MNHHVKFCKLLPSQTKKNITFSRFCLFDQSETGLYKEGIGIDVCLLTLFVTFLSFRVPSLSQTGEAIEWNRYIEWKDRVPSPVPYRRDVTPSLVS